MGRGPPTVSWDGTDEEIEKEAVGLGSAVVQKRCIFSLKL